jgi:hypothetical protein
LRCITSSPPDKKEWTFDTPLNTSTNSMKLKNIFLLIILFFYCDNDMLANGYMAGKEFIYENTEMRQILSFENNTISVRSVFDKKNQKELIAENALPYFEFQINKETVLSSMPVWEFIKYEERSLVKVWSIFFILRVREHTKA